MADKRADEAMGEAAAASLAPSRPAEDESPEAIDELQAELAETKDRLLRALAEIENFRRQSNRRREEAVRFAAAELVADLLPTADNLSRALENLPPGEDALQNLIAGVALAERALQDAFMKHGIRKIQPVRGEPFDPYRHEALFEVEAGDCPPGTVAEILQPGYAYHDRLLRPALVGVARPVDAQTPEQPR